MEPNNGSNHDTTADVAQAPSNIFDKLDNNMSMDSLLIQESTAQSPPAPDQEFKTHEDLVVIDEVSADQAEPKHEHTPEPELEPELDEQPATTSSSRQVDTKSIVRETAELVTEAGLTEALQTLDNNQVQQQQQQQQHQQQVEVVETQPTKEVKFDTEPEILVQDRELDEPEEEKGSFIEEHLSEFISSDSASNPIVVQPETELLIPETVALNDSQTTPTQTSLLQDAHQTFQTAAGNSIIEEEDKNKVADIMEFAKNYSDDLLGQCENDHHIDNTPTSADLADFELPPYSGSSSGSEPMASKSSPTGERRSSRELQHQPQTATIEPESLAQQASSSQTVKASPPSLTAFKDLIMSNYSRVSHIFHWKKPLESGIVFSIGFTLIIALTFFSIISVFAYSALGVILASGSMRLYKAVMKTLKKPTETPFDGVWNKILQTNVAMSRENMNELVDGSIGNFNSSLIYLKQVLLVEDKIATLKFGLFLYLLTYIGSWFNGMTLITICYLSLFSVPTIYEMNKAKIDQYYDLVGKQVSSTISMVTSKASNMAFGQNSLAQSSISKKQK